MEQSRSIGTILMAVSGIQMLLFMIGVMRRSYFAIALPIAGALAVASGLMFWVGYTMSSIEADAIDIDLEDEEPLDVFADA